MKDEVVHYEIRREKICARHGSNVRPTDSKSVALSN